MKKIAYVLSVCMTVSLLTGCFGQTENNTVSNGDADNSEVLTENNSDTAEDTTEVVEDSTTETQVVREIVDALPEGPAEANFGPDNIGFYMEGVEFTLPMAYSDFLAKVTELGWSIPEDGIRSSYNGDYKLTEVTFNRSVEGQEEVEWFKIEVINSAEPTLDVDLSSADIQVIFFTISLAAGKTDIYDSDSPRYTRNFNSQVYINKEVGLGRSINNAYADWGEPTSEVPLYDMWIQPGEDWRTITNYGATYAKPSIYLSSSKSSDEYTLYSELADQYGKCDDVITRIALSNNPFVQ